MFQNYAFLLLFASSDIIKYLKPLYFFSRITLRNIQHFARLHPHLKTSYPSALVPKFTQIEADRRVAVVVPLLG